jgi:hypothetical protein
VADVEALRAVPWERLIEGTVSVIQRFQRWGSWPLAFLPVLDGQVLRRHPADSLAEADVDAVAGWTKDEATFAFGLDDDVRNATESRPSLARGIPTTSDCRSGTRTRHSCSSTQWRARSGSSHHQAEAIGHFPVPRAHHDARGPLAQPAR